MARDFECFSWAAGMAASTKYPAVFATSHVPMYHPALAAKQATVIDHISNGRHAINIVGGWNQGELEMFGAHMQDHEGRYDMAAEWIEIMIGLWTLRRRVRLRRKILSDEEGRAGAEAVAAALSRDHECGRIGNRASTFPPNIPTSPLSSSTITISISPRTKVEKYRRLAREEYGREIQIWSFGYVVQRETEKEAKDFLHYYVHEKGDWVAAGNLIEAAWVSARLRSRTLASFRPTSWPGGARSRWSAPRSRWPRDWPILSKIGIDGALLYWPLYEEGMLTFQRETLPLLKQAGLR